MSDILGFRQLVDTELENQLSSHLTKHSSPARGKKTLFIKRTRLELVYRLT